jgi:hypothetical protein
MPYLMELKMKKNLLYLTLYLFLSACGGGSSDSHEQVPPPIEIMDSDLDGIPDQTDNCINNSNPEQTDKDDDQIGDVCDPVVAFKISNPIGDIANGQYSSFDLSDDGRFLVFVYTSQGQNLSEKTSSNIYLFDIENETTILVSSTPSGGTSNDVSDNALISKEGRFIYYESLASDIIGGDKGVRKIIRFDIQNQLNTLIPYDYNAFEVNQSADASGALGGARVSNDGYKLCLNSDIRVNTKILTNKAVLDTISSNVNKPKFYGECGEFVNSDNALYVISDENLVYESGEYGAGNLFSIDLVTGDYVPLFDESVFENITRPYVTYGDSSPDGNFIITLVRNHNSNGGFTNGQLFLINKLDSTVTMVVDGDELKSFFWGVKISDDGNFIYFNSKKLELATNTTTPLFDNTEYEGLISSYDISSDGRRVVGVTEPFPNKELVVLVLEPDS